MRVLIVDDDPDGGETLREFLIESGHQPHLCSSASEALAAFSSQPAPLVITDLKMPDIDGLSFMDRLRGIPQGNDADVVILTGHADLDTAIQALRRGAYDYLRKPLNVVELLQLVERCAEHRRLIEENRALSNKFDNELERATRNIRDELDNARRMLRKTRGAPEIVAVSQAITQLLNRARLYHADPSVPVLIEGETGTGKELFARAVHFGDDCADAPFFEVNCASIPHSLFESELFGYEPGAFSGGNPTGMRGKIELAKGGTLFLDEIGELPLELQPKLLRVLQDGSYYKLGGFKKQKFQARLICATNTSLERLAKEDKFRLDLFHRLKVGHLVIPPLRERTKDIPVLTQVFFQREIIRKKKAFKTISQDAMQLLQTHSWPGNVRELENAIERAVLENNGSELTRDHFRFINALNAPETTEPPFRAQPSPLDGGLPAHYLPAERFDLETWNENIVKQALLRFNNNMTKTALYLGISRNALYGRVKKMRRKRLEHEQA